MSRKFELDDNQVKRVKNWFKHHWEVLHKNWQPPDRSGFMLWYMFAPVDVGMNAKVVCVWCADDNPKRECDLSIDEDGDGDFTIEYDENWDKIPWKK